MTRIKSTWTAEHAGATALSGAVLCGAAFAGRAYSGWMLEIVAALLALTVLVGLAMQPLLALVVGLVDAATTIALADQAGRWDSSDFPSQGGLIFSFLVIGLVAGGVGTSIRHRSDPMSGHLGDLMAAAPGLLGLLPSNLGGIRLEEEIERARYAHDPLTVVRIEMDLLEAAPLAAADRAGISRAVTRVLESTLHVIDVPFAYAEDDIVVIMPETDALEARARCARILTATHRATLVDRTTNSRRPLGEVACLHVARVDFPEDGQTARELLDAAATGVARLRREHGYLATAAEDRLIGWGLPSPAELTDEVEVASSCEVDDGAARHVLSADPTFSRSDYSD